MWICGVRTCACFWKPSRTRSQNKTQTWIIRVRVCNFNVPPLWGNSETPTQRSFWYLRSSCVWFSQINCVTQLKLYTLDKLSSSIFCCLLVCQASVTPDQISTFSNIYRHTSPLLTMYHLIPISTNLYWPSTSQYRHIQTQYHQVQIMIHHPVRPSSANWKISLFETHLMSHAQYTWSSLH